MTHSDSRTGCGKKASWQQDDVPDATNVRLHTFWQSLICVAFSKHVERNPRLMPIIDAWLSSAARGVSLLVHRIRILWTLPLSAAYICKEWLPSYRWKENIVKDMWFTSDSPWQAKQVAAAESATGRGLWSHAGLRALCSVTCSCSPVKGRSRLKRGSASLNLCGSFSNCCGRLA